MRQTRRRTALRIHLFGSILVEDGRRRLGVRDFGGVKPKQILEILLLARGRLVSKDRLADLLWGETLPQNVSGTLETYVSVLRRRLAPEGDRGHQLVVTEPEAYRFDIGQAEIDLDRFDELIEAAGPARTKASRRYLEQALTLVRGDLLEDEPYAEWADHVRDRYSGRVLQALLEAAQGALMEHDYRAALRHAEAAIARDRFNERAYRTAMIALYALGLRDESLQMFRRCRLALGEELGEPGDETEELHAAIRRQDEPRSLLPGLARLAVTDAGASRVPLLGRSEEIAVLESVIRSALASSCALVLVEGEAGAGKSRLLEELAPRLVGARVGSGHCSELERKLPYVPLAAALRDALGDVAADRKQFPGLDEIMPELARSRPTRQPPQMTALESLVELVGRHAPLVLFLDDLHWADPDTIGALGYLQRRCASVPLVVVGSFRPEELSAGHALRRLEPAALVSLEPLRLDELEPVDIPHLYELTGGLPLFVAAAIADGDAGGLAETFSDSFAARCRAEGEYGHRVLVSACVLEQPFAPDALAAMLDLDPAELTEELERLCERRLLRVDDARFRFRYEVVQEALRRSLSPARLQLLSRKAGEVQELARALLATTGRPPLGAVSERTPRRAR